MPDDSIFRFDAFALDLAKRELRRDDIVVPVEPQVFSLLHLLVEQRDRVLSKDEIIDRVWDGRIVSDSALSSRIKSVRQALGDDGDSQKYLRTLRGHGFRFVGEVREETNAGAEASAIAADIAAVMARPLVAVFPLDQDPAAPQDVYFAEGIVDSLIAELSAWRWFPIVSRNATFDPRHGTLPMPTRAAALGARYAVSGRIRGSGDSARLTIELSDVENGIQLWSTIVERDRQSLLAMQHQIARDLVQRITPELDAAERRRVLRQPLDHSSAWDMTLKALWLLNHPTRDAFEAAFHQLDSATSLDPGASLPWSLRALARFEAGLTNWVHGNHVEAGTVYRVMLDDARRAIELDPNGWMGHALAGVGELWGSASYRKARFHADEAVTLNPSAGLAQHLSGCVFGFGGALDEAIAIQSGLHRIDPNYRRGDSIEADLGLWTFLSGDLDNARAHLESALAIMPGNARARQRMVAVFAEMDDMDGARAELARLEALGAPLTGDYVVASYPFQREEHAKLFHGALRRAGVAFE